MTEISKFVKELVARHGRLLIPILQDIQQRYNYLPEEALKEVAKKSKVPLRDIYGVATFYDAFSLTPKGKHIITVCLGTACHVRGGARILEAVERELGIKPGEVTPDYEFELQRVACVGCCALAPVMIIDGNVHGKMDVIKTKKVLGKYL